MNENRISERDYEDICAYLDNEMAQDELRRFALRLQNEPELKNTLEAVRRTKILLRSQPLLRAPRNYTLSRELVEKKKSIFGFQWSAKPLIQTASAFASFIFAFLFLYNLVMVQTSLNRVPMAAAPSQAEEPVMQMVAPTQTTGDLPEIPSQPYPGEQPMAKKVPDGNAPANVFPYPPAGEVGGMGGGEETGVPAIAEAPLMGVMTTTLMKPLTDTAVLPQTEIPVASEEVSATAEASVQTTIEVERKAQAETVQTASESSEQAIPLQTYWIRQAVLGLMAFFFGGVALFLWRWRK